MAGRVIGALDRINAAHPWSHNAAYTPWILARARSLGARGAALDVGCGAGDLARRLAGRCTTVTAIDRDGDMAALAHARLAHLEHVEVRQQAVEQLGDERFDLVTMVAVLHHLPLDAALDRVRALLRPGGTLLVVGLAVEGRADLPWTLTSIALNPIVGLLVHPRSATGRSGPSAPVAAPGLSFAETAAAFHRRLPGSRLRRGPFWRYRAVWTAPP